MTIPWILRPLISIPRNLFLYLLHGPSYFCWHLYCWQPAWSGCHATKETGNGRMCEAHCREAGYHNRRRTGCDLPPSAFDLAMEDLDRTLARIRSQREGVKIIDLNKPIVRKDVN